jgi:hypothetical protein
MATGILSIAWRRRTLGSKWGGGAAWTGQPAVVRWPQAIRQIMNIREPFRQQEGFTEVIQGSTSGHVYFFDLASGRPSRDPISVGNPIKGSVSVDPRGIPLLYVGTGIAENGPMGLSAWSLVDQRQLWFHPGIDPSAPKGWDAFDASPLVDSATDTLIQTGENGLLYLFKLRTSWNPATGELAIGPEAVKYRYNAPRARRAGIESSPALDRNLAWFADNGGIVQGVNLRTLQPLWHSWLGDDTDATVVVDREDRTPFVYAGTEVDQQGTAGLSRVRRFHGLTGTMEWERTFPCRSVLGERPVNGGMLATPAVGKGLLGDLLFLNLARHRNLQEGLLLAVNKQSGKTVWERRLRHYSWSSPVDFYTADGVGFLLLGDSGGTMTLFDGATGEEISRVALGGIVEASPVFFEDQIIAGTRNNEILCIRIE